MKRGLGIGILIILNLTFIYVIIIGANLSFGFAEMPFGDQSGLKTLNYTTKIILIKLSPVAIAVLSINYILIKKMIGIRNPFLLSLTVTFIGIIVFVPFFLSARQSFINYQNGTKQLQDLLFKETIIEAHIITSRDTIKVEKLDDFLTDIGSAKYRRGIWKYAKKFKLMFKRSNGSIDSIFTNGQLFGGYKAKYFSTNTNIIEKYLDNE